MLGQLKEGDIIDVGIDHNDSHQLLLASSELVVHNAIYRNTALSP